uniref:Uncharacterized protein n=1 Tax=Anguilla anguilla TaxID=7936 RepID=A0A0E9SZF4_ANGAN
MVLQCSKGATVKPGSDEMLLYQLHIVRVCGAAKLNFSLTYAYGE